MKREKDQSPFRAAAHGPPAGSVNRFYVNGRYLLREIAGVYVLIPTGETDAKQNSITALNETGCFLWKQFERPHTIQEAARAAQEAYSGQMEDILRDTERFVRTGIQAGLLCEAADDHTERWSEQ